MSRFLIVILFILNSLSCLGQEVELANLIVEGGSYNRQSTMVGARLDGMDLNLAERQLVLYHSDGHHSIVVASQLDMQNGPVLWWRLVAPISKGHRDKYVLKSIAKKSDRKSKTAVQVSNDDGNILISLKGKNILQYNFKEDQLPEGVPAIFRRAGFIHPLWSPEGAVLTRTRPPDHWHHVGLWNPWTHTKYKGRIIDFWNLIKAEGTVKPVEIISTTSNDLFGGFKVLQNHVDLYGETPEGYEVALKEIWDVRVWNQVDGGWLIDFSSTLNCATDSSFEITKYRYQGFGFRATALWNDQTANILTSEGKNKSDGNSTRARWCDVNGISETPAGTSGILFITNPANFNYPEPIRIWPTGSNKGKENVFFNFNPSMDRNWTLLPGNQYTLRYRMFVYDGKIDKTKAQALWADFAYPPVVVVKKQQ